MAEEFWCRWGIHFVAHSTVMEQWSVTRFMFNSLFNLFDCHFKISSFREESVSGILTFLLLSPFSKPSMTWCDSHRISCTEFHQSISFVWPIARRMGISNSENLAAWHLVTRHLQGRRQTKTRQDGPSFCVLKLPLSYRLRLWVKETSRTLWSSAIWGVGRGEMEAMSFGRRDHL